MTRRMLRLTALLLPVVMAGCSAISALDQASQPLEVFELRAPGVESAASRRNMELVVEEPVASGALATERIMIRPAPLQVQYLPGVRWADPAPTMLQTLLVRSLSETGAFSSTGRRPVGPRADFAVLSELTDFQAEVVEGSGGASVKVRLVIRIVREGDAAVTATRTFSATDISATTDPRAIVESLDRATAKVLAAAIPWIVSRTR